MYKKDLTLNDWQWLICHKAKLNQTKQIKREHISFTLGKLKAKLGDLDVWFKYTSRLQDLKACIV